MIPCRLSTDDSDKNDMVWPRHSCSRCGRSWHMNGLPPEWRGDPVYCNSWPEKWEVGYWVLIVLASVGVTTSRYEWLKYRAGIGSKCGFQQRAETMNTWGQKLREILSRLWR